jgi:hypothetical protein
VVRAVVRAAAGVADGVVGAAGVVARVMVMAGMVVRVAGVANVAGGVVGTMTGLRDARHGEHGDRTDGEKRLAHWDGSFLGSGGM